MSAMSASAHKGTGAALLLQSRQRKVSGEDWGKCVWRRRLISVTEASQSGVARETGLGSFVVFFLFPSPIVIVIQKKKKRKFKIRSRRPGTRPLLLSCG
jgi:hypothetical protein